MIDEEIINRYPTSERNALIDAFKTLTLLGIFTAQANENAMRICSGFNQVSSEELAKQIMQVQQTNRNLLALHELAGNLKKEESNA